MVVLQKLQRTLSSKKCWLTDHGYQDTPARPTEQPMLMTERVLRGERGWVRVLLGEQAFRHRVLVFQEFSSVVPVWGLFYCACLSLVRYRLCVAQHRVLTLRPSRSVMECVSAGSVSIDCGQFVTRCQIILSNIQKTFLLLLSLPSNARRT